MLRLRDIMTKDVLTVTQDLAVRDAMALLASRHVSGAPVIDKAKWSVCFRPQICWSSPATSGTRSKSTPSPTQ